jgi:hypothetical protein
MGCLAIGELKHIRILSLKSLIVESIQRSFVKPWLA